MAVSTSTACYQYVPAQQTNLRVGEEVRVHLTGSGSSLLSPVVGQNVEAIDGRLTAQADSAYAMSVGGTTRRAGKSAAWSGEQVSVPVGAIEKVDRRVLNKKKTFLGSALGVAGVALMAALISSISGGGSGGPDTGTTPP